LSFVLYYVHATYANVMQWVGIPRGRGERLREFLDLRVDPSIGDLGEKWVLVTK